MEEKSSFSKRTHRLFYPAGPLISDCLLAQNQLGVLMGGPRGPGPLNFGNKELYISIVDLDVILGPLRPERSTYDSVLVSLYFWK